MQVTTPRNLRTFAGFDSRVALAGGTKVGHLQLVAPGLVIGKPGGAAYSSPIGWQMDLQISRPPTVPSLQPGAVVALISGLALVGALAGRARRSA